MKHVRMALGLIAISLTFLQAAPINAPAPRFTLTNVQKESRSLINYKGKIVLINFWASWCAPCQVELPELSRLATEYKGKKVKVLAINVDEDRAAARKVIAKLGLKSSALEILLDSKSKVVSSYNIESMPSSFLLDSKGIIRFTHEGFHPQDPGLWRQEIDSLLAPRS